MVQCIVPYCDFTGNIQNCKVSAIELIDGRLCIIANGINEEGVPITNCIENLATALIERFDPPPERLLLIEHHKRNSLSTQHPEFFDIVSFGSVSKLRCNPVLAPQWERINQSYIKMLLMEAKERVLPSFQ